MDTQTELLEAALWHIQKARALLSEYDASKGKIHEGRMVKRLTGLVNEVNIERYKV